MANLRIALAAANFGAANIGKSPILTDRTNLVGEYFFGRDNPTSIVNMADTTKPLTLIGSATYAARAATITGVGVYYETGLADAAALTILSVASFGGTSVQLAGSFSGSNGTDATCLLRNGSSQLFAQVPAVSGIQTTTVFANTTPATDLRGVALRTSGTTDFVVKVDEFKANARIQGVAETKTGQTRKVSATTLRLGAPASGSTYVSSQSIAFVGIWQRAMTDGELLAAYQQVYAQLAAWSVAA